MHSHDEATNTESWLPWLSDTLICKSKTNLHNRDDLQILDKPNDSVIVPFEIKEKIITDNSWNE